jgi:hypothetical protein
MTHQTIGGRKVYETEDQRSAFLRVASIEDLRTFVRLSNPNLDLRERALFAREVVRKPRARIKGGEQAA